MTHTTELSKVDIAFRLLRLDNAYVCNAGRLVGVITRDSLADFVDQREVSPMDDCLRCGRPKFRRLLFGQEKNKRNGRLDVQVGFDCKTLYASHLTWGVGFLNFCFIYAAHASVTLGARPPH